jgi:Arc-like DNA binding domain
MKNVINSMRVVLTMPREVRDYLATKARYNQTSMSGEVVRQIRAQMEKDRVAPANRPTVANATA